MLKFRSEERRFDVDLGPEIPSCLYFEATQKENKINLDIMYIVKQTCTQMCANIIFFIILKKTELLVFVYITVTGLLL